MRFAVILLCYCFSGPAVAQSKADAKAKEDIAPLATECKAIAIGKYCGMRHRH